MFPVGPGALAQPLHASGKTGQRFSTSGALALPPGLISTPHYIQPAERATGASSSSGAALVEGMPEEHARAVSMWFFERQWTWSLMEFVHQRFACRRGGVYVCIVGSLHSAQKRQRTHMITTCDLATIYPGKPGEHILMAAYRPRDHRVYARVFEKKLREMRGDAMRVLLCLQMAYKYGLTCYTDKCLLDAQSAYYVAPLATAWALRRLMPATDSENIVMPDPLWVAGRLTWKPFRDAAEYLGVYVPPTQARLGWKHAGDMTQCRS